MSLLGAFDKDGKEEVKSASGEDVTQSKISSADGCVVEAASTNCILYNAVRQKGLAQTDQGQLRMHLKWRAKSQHQSQVNVQFLIEAVSIYSIN